MRTPPSRGFTLLEGQLRSTGQRPAPRGFTLLEVMIALAILSVSLVAIAAINAGAVNMHVYAKRLTIATMLARSKMSDLESKLHADGLPATDEQDDGKFDEEGFPEFTWHAEILKPKLDNLSPEQIMNMFGGGDGKEGEGGGLASKLGLGGAAAASGATGGQQGGMGGMFAGAMQMQMSNMIKQLGDALREVRLTVSWPDGKRVDSFTVVTHVVSLGPGTDQLQSQTSAMAPGQAVPGVPTLPGQTPPQVPPTRDGSNPFGTGAGPIGPGGMLNLGGGRINPVPMPFPRNPQ